MVSRVFTVALSFVRIIPCELTPTADAGVLIKPRRSSHLPIYFQTVERPPAPKSAAQLSAAGRNQCHPPRCRRRRKAHGPRRGEISRSYRGNEVEIAPLMNDDDVPRVMETRRCPAGGTGLLIIIKRTVPGAHDRARMNVAEVRARVRACVNRCTHDRIRISAIAIGKSSEPFITLIPTLILNRWHELPSAVQKARRCLFQPCKKFMNKAHLHATPQTLRTTLKAFVTPVVSRVSCPLTYFSHSRRSNLATTARNVTTLQELSP